MNFIIWDVETDSADTNYATIIEIGAILLDENFREKERFSARCRLPQDRVPSATALCVNKSSIDMLTRQNLSHYQMLNQIENKFKEWSPATFLGFSSINFDDEVLRKEFFKSLREPYFNNTKGNQRHDALNIVRAAYAVDSKILKTELNAKGNVSMKLESLGRLNGFNTEAAHSALFDSELCGNVLSIIKQKQPILWDEYFRTSSKQAVEEIVKKETILTVNEYFYSRSRLYSVAPLHPSNCTHPIYKWAQAVDLRIDPEPLFKLSYQELKKEMQKSPKFLRTIRSNKAPIIIDPSFAMQVEPYSAIGLEVLKKRAELVKSNAKFAQDVCNILKENAEEKMETSSQLDLEPEETIYTKFATDKDKFLFPKFHASEDWKEKFAMLEKFEDERMHFFGEKLIYNEAPEILPEQTYKRIKKQIAERIFSLNKEKWWTIPAAQKEIDDLRENDGRMFSFKTKEEKLNFLEGIDQYISGLEKKYADA